MKLILIIMYSVFFYLIGDTAIACENFILTSQPSNNGSYNPNNRSGTVASVELSLLDGPADPSCMTQIVEIRSRSTVAVRNFANGSSLLSGSALSDQGVLSTLTSTSLRLSQSAVARLVSTGSLVIAYAFIQPGSFSPSGRYTNGLSVTVNGIEFSTFQSEIFVSPAIRLLGEVSGGRGNLDFGILESNKELTKNFIYQSNTMVSVRASSENGGVMVHEQGVEFGSIPYSAFVGQRRISTDGTQLLELDTRVGQQSLESIRLRIGEVGNPTAGEYSDVITLNFSAS